MLSRAIAHPWTGENGIQDGEKRKKERKRARIILKLVANSARGRDDPSCSTQPSLADFAIARHAVQLRGILPIHGRLEGQELSWCLYQYTLID